jgi:DNA uptake protein ComE-like DNA-binding protein
MKNLSMISMLVLVGFVFFNSVPVANAGFGGSFFNNVQKNLQRDAKKKAAESKRKAEERARQEAEEAQRNAVSEVSGGVVDGQDVDLDNFKESYKEEFKEGVNRKAKDKATEITPLAACDNSEEMKTKAKSSFQQRIDAMKARLSTEKMIDQTVEGTTGVNISDEDGDERSLSEKIQDRLDAAKNAPANIAEDKMSNLGGGLDSTGLSSDNIDLNTASAEQFAAVDGIELSDGEKIVNFRNSNGSIESRDLIDVIGYKKYLVLRTQIREDEDDDDDDLHE